jgi:excisionase family DNA binding protein
MDAAGMGTSSSVAIRASFSGPGARGPCLATLPEPRWGGRYRLLRVREVADRLGVSNATVYGLCERGELPYVAAGSARWRRGHKVPTRSRP